MLGSVPIIDKWTLRDRVAQTAAVRVLEPIFETDLRPEQHAYRASPALYPQVTLNKDKGIEDVECQRQ